MSGEWPTELKFGHASFEDLKNVTDFMYNGQVEVRGRDLDGFLQLAHSIQLKGFPVPGSAEQGLNGVSPVLINVKFKSTTIICVHLLTFYSTDFRCLCCGSE